MMKVDQLDENVATDLLKRLDQALAPLCGVMDEAVGLGFQPIWDAIAIQPNGRHGPVNLRLVRVYKR